jgi:hypothetical protein
MPTPPVLAADASEADRIATNTVDDAAVDAYNQHVVDFSEALSSYRDAQKWCDEDAHDAAALTTSVLPQFPLSSWPLLELLRCGITFASGISPLVTLSICVWFVRSMLSSRVIPMLRSSTHRVLLFGVSLTLSALLYVGLVRVARL